MGTRGNLFANVENPIKNTNREDLPDLTVNEMLNFVSAARSLTDAQKIKLITVAAQVGMCKSSIFRSYEEEAVKSIFGIFLDDTSKIYKTVKREPTEADLEMLRKTQYDIPDAGIPLLRLILCFAYLDGMLEEVTAKYLETAFAPILVKDFMDSGLESVPPQEIQITVTELEADIVRWFQEEFPDGGGMKPLNEIVAHFPGKTKAQIKTALDSLCEKGVMFGGANFIGNMYGLS